MTGSKPGDKSAAIADHIKAHFDGIKQDLGPGASLRSFLLGKGERTLKELIPELRGYTDLEVRNALRLDSLKGRAKKAKPSNAQDNNDNNNHLSAAASENLQQPPQLPQGSHGLGSGAASSYQPYGGAQLQFGQVGGSNGLNGNSVGGSDLAQPPVDNTVRNQINAAVDNILRHYNHRSRQAHIHHGRSYAETLTGQARINNSGSAHNLNDAPARNNILANIDIDNGNHLICHQAYMTLQHVQNVAIPLRNANQTIMNQITLERAALQQLIQLLQNMDNVADQTYNDIETWNNELQNSLNFANQTMNGNPNPAPANAILPI